MSILLLCDCQVIDRCILLLYAVAAREATGMTRDDVEVDAAGDVPAGGRLVRVPIDELQQAEQK